MDSITQNYNVEDFLNNTASSINFTIHNVSEKMDKTEELFESVVEILVPIIFGIVCILGFVGNLMVIIVVLFDQQMRNTTNILILNLAFADLFFIIICVPFTAITYANPVWIFGIVWCKIYQFVINVTAYGSVYTLVLMSLDRYLAVVHPLSSMSMRTMRNTWITTIILWLAICIGNLLPLHYYDILEYEYNGANRSACIYIRLLESREHGQIFYGCFFAFGYVLPLSLVVLLYGLMIRKLRYGVPNLGPRAREANRAKRVTVMIIIVIVMFATCWLPVQTIFMIQFFGKYPDTTIFIGVKIASTCLAYMNSCMNPFLYAFFSENFRKSFRKLLHIFKRNTSRSKIPLKRMTTRTEENGV